MAQNYLGSPLSPALRHPRAATSHSNRQSARRVARGTATSRRSHRKSHHLSWGCDKRWHRDDNLGRESIHIFCLRKNAGMCRELTMIYYDYLWLQSGHARRSIDRHAVACTPQISVWKHQFWALFFGKTVSPNCCKVVPRASLMQYNSKGKWDIMG